MRRSSSDNIYEHIKNDILLGNIQFGEKIVEIDLSEKLNVSRTPLREAIKKLEIEGIIIRLPNGRLRVMDITYEKIEEIFDIRIALEEILFESIIKNKDALDKIFYNLLMTKHSIDNKDWKEARILFLEYNSLLYSLSSLEYTIKILKHYDFIISSLKRTSLQSKDRILVAYNEHVEISTFLIKGNLEGAKNANKNHILKSKEIIRKQFFSTVKIESYLSNDVRNR